MILTELVIVPTDVTDQPNGEIHWRPLGQIKMLKLILSITIVALLGVLAADAAPLPASAIEQTPMDVDFSTNSNAMIFNFSAPGCELTLFSLEIGNETGSGTALLERAELFEGMDSLLRRVFAVNARDLLDRLRSLDLNQ